MYLLLAITLVALYLTVVTMLSYKLGVNKTEDPKRAAIIGFLLAFLPPLAFIYLVFLLLKDDSDIV